MEVIFNIWKFRKHAKFVDKWIGLKKKSSEMKQIGNWRSPNPTETNNIYFFDVISVLTYGIWLPWWLMISVVFSLVTEPIVSKCSAPNVPRIPKYLFVTLGYVIWGKHRRWIIVSYRIWRFVDGQFVTDVIQFRRLLPPSVFMAVQENLELPECSRKKEI